MEGDINIDARDRKNKTPLHYAACEGYLEVVHILVEHGAGVEARDDVNRTPLHSAAESGHEDIMIYLFTSGANVEARDVENCTPIDLLRTEHVFKEPLVPVTSRPLSPQ